MLKQLWKCADFLLIESMDHVPKDLLAEIRNLEEQFTVPTAKLKELTEHFVNELTRGEVIAFLLRYLLTRHRSQR